MADEFIILLSTFNGERYLEELLDSLVKQEEANCTIIVRDDGSTDRTLQILESFKSLLKIELHIGKNMGPSASFKILMEVVGDRNFDYIAFCDQDDVWLADKLNRAVTKLRETKKSQYASKRLCFSDQSKEKTLFPKFVPKINFKDSIFENYGAGCTIVMSHRHFKNLMKIGCTEIEGNYDHIIQVMSIILNECYFDAESRILYRLHDENSIGVLHMRMRRISKTSEEIQIKMRMIQMLVPKIVRLMSDQDQRIANDLLFEGKNLKRCFLIFKLPKMRHNQMEDLVLKIFLIWKRH